MAVMPPQPARSPIHNMAFMQRARGNNLPSTMQLPGRLGHSTIYEPVANDARATCRVVWPHANPFSCSEWSLAIQRRRSKKKDIHAKRRFQNEINNSIARNDSYRGRPSGPAYGKRGGANSLRTTVNGARPEHCA